MNLNEALIIVFLVISSGIVAADDLFETTVDPGNYVWDNNTTSLDSYTWDARTFSGFYYDLDSGKYSESITIKDIDRTIDSGDIIYEAVAIEKDFEHDGWGKYNSIGFFGEEYFVAYTDNTTFDGAENTNTLSSGQLHKIFCDNDDACVVYSDSGISFDDGYYLSIIEINDSENTVILSLEKDGVEVDRKKVSVGNDYVYKQDVGNVENLTLIAVHIRDVFCGEISEAVIIEGIFQITNAYLELETGDQYSEMEIVYYSSTRIGMENEDPIYLTKGSNIHLMNEFYFKVADNETLRFAPFVDKWPGHTYSLRGTVTENNTFTWTPLNFEGFYYDINDSIGCEKLEVKGLDGRIINEGDLVYTSTIQETSFKANYSDLDPAEFPDKYPVIGLFGEMYVPLANNTPDKLTKLLVDNNEEHLLTVGDQIDIGGGYAVLLNATNTTEDKLLLYLFKDYEKIENYVVTVGDNGGTLVHTGEALTEDDIPILRIHFSNMSQNQTTIDGIWLRDEENAVEIGIDDSYSKLSVSEIGDNYLKLTNTENVTLFRNSIIEIADDYLFRIADDDELRYYPYTETTIEKGLSIDSFSPETLNPESYNGSATTFNIELNQKADVTWVLDGVKLFTNTSVTTASYVNTSARRGIHNLKVTAKNENGSAEKQWTWFVNEYPFEFIDVEPADDCSIYLSETQDFYVKMPYNSNISWYLDDNLVQSDYNVIESNYTFDSVINNKSSTLNHFIKVIASNESETYHKEWKCSVKKITINSGETWELKNGYSLTIPYLDIDGNKALFTLTKDGALVDQLISFEDGYYYYNRSSAEGIEEKIIKIYASDMFYGSSDRLVNVEEIEQYSDEGTVDTNPIKLLESEEKWELGNGYSLGIVGVDENEDYCVLSLEKDGTIVDQRIMASNTVYSYQRMNKDTSDTKTILEIPIINVLNSISKEFVEFSIDYTNSSDSGTVDIDPFILLRSGERWELDDGYSIGIEEISGQKAFVSIEKNSIVLDYDIIDENDIFTYNRLNAENKTINPIIIINSSKIFNGNSEDYIEFISQYQVNSDVDTVVPDNRSILESGNTFEFDNNFILTLASTGVNNKKAMFNLTKDGKSYDEFILDIGDYYYLNKTVDGTEMTIISFQLENVFFGENNRIAIINKIIQNPDFDIDEISIQTTEKDISRIRSPIYCGTDLTDIVGYDDTDNIVFNASDFAGFFYNLDKDVSTEKLAIFGGSYVSGNVIETNGTIYTTKRTQVEYESSNIEGYYDFFGLFGERYVPLSENTLNKSAKLLIDTDEKIVLKERQTLYLPNGYELTPLALDVSGDKVWFELDKNGEFIEDETIDVLDNEMWVYDKDLAGKDDVVVLKMKVTDIIQPNDNYGSIIIEGLWLIDFENIMEINVSDNFSEMQVSAIGADFLEMKNPNPISLERNSTIKITDEYCFMVADNDELEFCLAEEIDDSGTYEVRGSISENAAKSEWNPVNFEGFYYGFDGNGGTETLVATISDRNIESGNLTYQTSPTEVIFMHEEWGKYSAMGLLGEKYLTSYIGLGTANLLSNDVLSRVLIDNNDESVLCVDSALILENGYELEVQNIDTDNDTLRLSLTKDGLKIDTAEVYSNTDYIYKADIQSLNNVPIVAVHFNKIVEENGVGSAYVNGIFQISDQYLTLSTGDTFGQMEISSLSADGITMLNGNDIFLEGGDLNITDSLYFKVADDGDNVRFYPFMEVKTPGIKFRTVNPANKILDVKSGSCQVFEASATITCDHTWLVNGAEIQSNNSCMKSAFSYTPSSSGSYIVTVEAENPDNSEDSVLQTWNITVTVPASDSGSSSSSGGGGGGGGGSGTGEDSDNVMIKEVVRQNVVKDTEISYKFGEKDDPVSLIKFTALKNSGYISAIIEVLNDKSAFADTEAPNEVYQYVNMWIGKNGFATSANMEDAQITFRVKKSWLEANNIAHSDICLYRYNSDTWNELVTEKIDEDDDYVYYVSKTPGFSPFAIAGKISENAATIDGDFSSHAETQSSVNNTSSQEPTSIPGLGITATFAVFALCALILGRRN